jgi:hypothetical protein
MQNVRLNGAPNNPYQQLGIECSGAFLPFKQNKFLWFDFLPLGRKWNTKLIENIIEFSKNKTILVNKIKK